MRSLPVRPLLALGFLVVGLLLAGCAPTPPAPAVCTPGGGPADAPAGVEFVSCPPGVTAELTIDSTLGFGLSAITPSGDWHTDWTLDVQSTPCPVQTITFEDNPRVELVPCPGNAVLSATSEVATVYAAGNTDHPGTVTVSLP